MVALHEDEKAKVTYGCTASKRPRLDNILNKYPETRSEPREIAKIVNLPRVGSISKTKKKRSSSNKASPNTEWAKRPKRDSYSGSESENNEESDEDDEADPLSYLTTYINKETIPLFLDPGAAYSIISDALLKSLNIRPTKLKVPIRINPVSGNAVNIRKGVEMPIEFDDGTILMIPFIVLRECAVPIFLGLDACMRMKAKINYEDETYSIRIQGKKHVYKLYRNETIAEEFSENLGVEEGEGDDSIPLLYASIESVISEAAYMDPLLVKTAVDYDFAEELDKKINSELNNKYKNKVKNMLRGFSEVFAHSLDDLTGIKSSEYSLKIGPEENPSSAYGHNANVAPESTNLTEISWEQICRFLSGKTDEHEPRVRQQARNFVLLDGNLFRKTKLGLKKLILEINELYEILKELHDKKGHFAFESVYGYLKGKYWRPRLLSEVKHYVQSCSPCQKYLLRRPRYKLDGRSGISGIFSVIQMDHLGPLPESKSWKKHILVCVDRLSGYPWAWPVADQTADTTLQCLKELVATISPPGAISCDNASGFQSNLIKKFCRERKIRLEYNIPYQPEWLGAVERMNSTIRYSLARTCNEDYDEWDLKLPKVLAGIRMRTSSRTGYSPFYLVYGIESRFPIELEQDLIQRARIRDIELETIPGARADAIQPSKHAKFRPRFDIGSMVLALNARLR
ncbi:Pro-Pol polyprotein [Smittium culicis]|uniref:Pro-Pol polyprotein n=1 Tax=Smittium culicis TaxID=133412 RepID=A0A1R1YJ27_9FUNG|nr:Pro-Pol polyprotein [Smittium culicis]